MAKVLPTAAADVTEGIYFGLPDTIYHDIPALSASGVKMLRVSTLDFWSRSWMNANREEDIGDESDAQILGTAYHARILEGRDVFLTRFAPDIDPKAYPNALRTADDVQGRLRDLKKQGAEVKLNGKKGALIDALLALEPTAQIWDVICDGYAKEHPGKTFLPPDLMDKIEFSAAMIERKPDLKDDFRNGMPEVTVVYRCPDTEILCKLRMDYLKPRSIKDLKSFSNVQQRPIKDAIRREFANRRMPYQAAWYLDGARYIASFVKRGQVFGEVEKDFLIKLASDYEKDFKFVFVQKGPAPVARGWRFSPKLGTFEIAKARNDTAKMHFAECLAAYPDGAPWVDAVPTEDFNDEEIPTWATD